MSNGGPIDLGIGFEELEKKAAPPLIPDGNYEGSIEKVDSSPVKESGKTPGRPQWKFTIKLTDRPDIPEVKNRSVFVYAQLPWVNPATGQWDYDNIFTIVGVFGWTGFAPRLPNADPTGDTFYGIQKEEFIGNPILLKIGHEERKDAQGLPTGEISNTTRIINKKKPSGGTVA